MLQVNNLSVHYGDKRIINDISFTLSSDEILMLVGPTGCGKTTILQCVAGLVPQSAGEVAFTNWRSTSQKHIPPEKRNLGMVFQDFALFPHLTVEQNVCFRVKDSTLADQWIELLGLNDKRHVKPGNLSGGQKQRVALARTLAHQPSVVLLDEPLSNLDAALKDSLRWDIRDALKRAKVPAIWVTHDQSEALSVGDRVGVLKDGILQQLDTPERCFSAPSNPFVARFLGEATFLRGQVQPDGINSALGVINKRPESVSDGEVQILVRPDDVLFVESGDKPNGTIDYSRYEGETRLFGITLHSGESIKLRANHEVVFKPGDNVQVAFNANESPAVFPAESNS